MLFQQVNKNTPERIWMVCQNADNNNEDLVEGNLVNWQIGADTDIGKEVMGLKVSKWMKATAPSYLGGGVVRKGSKTVRYGEFGIIQVYGFYDGVLTDGSVIPADTLICPSATTPGTVAFTTPATSGAFSSIVGTSLIASTDYTAHGLTNKVGVFLKMM